MVKENTIHTFKVPAIDGGEIDFSAFKGKISKQEEKSQKKKVG